jgi:6-phosphogluconate dehydrogenase
VLSSRSQIYLLNIATPLEKLLTDSADGIFQAYDRDPNLPSLLVDDEFAQELVDRQGSWRKVLQLAIGAGISTAGMTAR